MDVRKIVAEIDAKIASLQQARTVLLGLDESTAVNKPRRGRPKGSANTVKASAEKKTRAAKPTKKRRNLSPEGRKRIAEAMKRRWAERRNAIAKAAKKVATKQEATPKK